MQQEATLPNQTYSFQLQNFTLSMLLNDSGDIQMEFFYKQSGKLYELFINQQFMNENPFLAVIFGSPKCLFADILANTNKLSANDEGLVTYTILVNAKSMPLSFHSKQKKVTKKQKLLKLISQLKKDQEALKQENLQLRQELRGKVQLDKFNESNLMMLSEIKKLQNSYEKLKNKLEKQKNIIIEHRQQIKALKAQLQDANWKIVQLRQDKQTEGAKRKLQMEDEQFQIIAENKYDQNNNQLLQTLNKKYQKQIMKIKTQQQANQKIIAQMNTGNAKNFEILKHKGNLKLKNIGGEYTCTNVFFRPFTLEVNKQTRLQVRQIKTNPFWLEDGSIYYGVSSDKGIVNGGGRAYYHDECAYYSSSNGRIRNNGRQRKGGAAINDGTIVTIVADLIKWKISWEVNGEKLAGVEISRTMSANNLYFIIVFHAHDDEVEILDY